MPLAEEGPRTEPPVSVPSPNCANDAAMPGTRAATRAGRPARQVVRIVCLQAHRAEAVRNGAGLQHLGVRRATDAAAAAGELAQIDLRR